MPGSQEQKQNKMGSMPVPKLLLNMGLPMMLSMVSLALYNLVDTFFVSRIPDTAEVIFMGDKAVNALALAHPIQTLIISLGVGVGIGINTQTAQNLGKKDYERASRIAGNAMMIGGCIYLLMLLFGIFGAESFIRSQTDSELIAGMGTAYLRIVSILSLGTVGHMCLEKVVMATGRTTSTMIAQLAGALVNIILDPILIFGWLGLPQMGVIGAAVATVAGQFVSLILIAFFLFGKCKEIHIKPGYLKPDPDILKPTFTIAGPAILMQLAAPVMGYGMNLILGGISPSAVTAYGVYGRLQYIVTMPVFGLNNASIPSASFNRGTGRFDRIRQIIKYDLIYDGVIMLIFIAVLQIFAYQIVGIFSISGESFGYAITAVRIITCGYLFLGSNILLQGICQSLGKGLQAMFITFIRSVIVVLPLAYIFSKTQFQGVLTWAALPIAEAAGFVFSVIFVYRAYKDFVREKI